MRVRYYYPATSSKLQFVLYADGQKIAIRLSRRITSITKQIKKMLNEHNSKYSSTNRMSWEDVTALPVNCSSFTTSSIPDSTKQQVLVITPLRGMLLVYRPDTRGRVAPEGGGSINRNIPTRGVIISL